MPVSIALIFFMLFQRSARLGRQGSYCTNTPFGSISGVASLFLWGLYLSVPASVGFITL